MNELGKPPAPATRGLLLRMPAGDDGHTTAQAILAQLDATDLAPHVLTESGRDAQGDWLALRLDDASRERW
ncbi:MAG: hypothetical protein OEY75_00690, partial [Hylemonella sp.]|nr:hypothetical protein [Hylemonella sp.]